MKYPAAALCLVCLAFAQTPAERLETPAALVLVPGDARRLPASSHLPLHAKAGEPLFAGDSLLAGSQPVEFLFCAGKSRVLVAPNSEVLFSTGAFSLRRGSVLTRQPVPVCLMPELERRPSATRRHMGESLHRDYHTDPAGAVTFKERLLELAEPTRSQLLRELEPLDGLLRANADDAVARQARALVLAKYGMHTDALEEFSILEKRWPEAAWLREKRFIHGEAAVKQPRRTGPGRTYAVVIGLSEYRSPEIPKLAFAHNDAELFGEYLRTRVLDPVQLDELVLLTNRQAHKAAIDAALSRLIKVQAGASDRVLIFISGHGVVDKEGHGYIVAYDSNPDDLKTSALSMEELHKLIEVDLAPAGRVFAYVDVCRAGLIRLYSGTERMRLWRERLRGQKVLFGFAGSRATEESYEKETLRRGVFSFYLEKGLSGLADQDGDGSITIDEIIEYVRPNVRLETRNRQTPEPFNVTEYTTEIARVPQSVKRTLAARPETIGEARARNAPAPQDPETARLLAEYRRALTGGPRPEALGPATALLEKLSQRLARPAFLAEKNRLRTELEERGQRVLVRYLAGEESPQRREDFETAAEYFHLAEQLTPESLWLEARRKFCLGRAAVFTRDFAKAVDLLEDSVRLDPDRAYAYNALGIAYLEQADFQNAERAFLDAVQRAPYWAYPLHNLALLAAERGDYARAVQAYRNAVGLAPDYAYLPYNLGVLYQRLNRRRDAERAYRQALDVRGISAQMRAAVHNALGLLDSASGRDGRSEQAFQQALGFDPELLAARQNLAVLIASKPSRLDEAVRLWRENLRRDPEYVPSRLSLGNALAGQGKAAEAAAEYHAVVAAKPEYVAARLKLAALLAYLKQPEAALQELKQALERQPANFVIHEQIGDIETARGEAAAARTAYQTALDLAPDRSSRNRIRRKLSR